VKRTFTSKLSNMLGTHKKGCSRSPEAPFALKKHLTKTFIVRDYGKRPRTRE
jgi:hypothetical protein